MKINKIFLGVAGAAFVFSQPAEANIRCDDSVIQIGTDSYYVLPGNKTEIEEFIRVNALTTVHKILPLVPHVNDCGPFVGERILDLTPGVVKALDLGKAQGLYNVMLRTYS